MFWDTAAVVRAVGLGVALAAHGPALAQQSNAASTTQDNPASLLERAAKALSAGPIAQYQVQRAGGYSGGESGSFNGRSTIVVELRSFRFASTLRNDAGTVVQSAASDGTTTKADKGTGQIQEGPTFSGEAIVVLNDAVLDVAGTKAAIDPAFLRKAASSDSVMSAGDDEIDGEPCRVVLFVSRTVVGGSPSVNTFYYWLSTTTGLPKAVQRWSLVRGRTNLSQQFLISNLRLSESVDASAFRLTAAAKGASAGPAAAAVSAPSVLAAGTMLPALRVQDLSLKNRTLTEFTGKPLLITLWAPWCSPCLSEFTALISIVRDHPDLNVVAIGVKDARTNVVSFLKGHPEYPFTFVTDPDMQLARSTLYDAIAGKDAAIPAGLLVDRSGRIVERLEGFTGQDDLAARIKSFMQRH